MSSMYNFKWQLIGQTMMPNLLLSAEGLGSFFLEDTFSKMVQTEFVSEIQLRLLHASLLSASHRDCSQMCFRCGQISVEVVHIPSSGEPSWTSLHKFLLRI